MPRQTHQPLTDRLIRDTTAGTTPVDVRDGFLPGLILTVHPSGKRLWSIRYRARDERRNAIVQRRAALGSYPGLSIAKARKAGRLMQSAIDGDRDPVAERREKAAVRTDTVEALAAEYMERHAKKKKRSWREDQRVIDVYLLPCWRQRSVRDVSRRDVRSLVEAVADRGAPIMANRVLEVIRKMFNFGITRDWLDGNPAARVQKPGVERKRERVLSDDELRELWALLGRFPSTTERQAPGRKRATVDAHGQPFCPVSPSLAAIQKLRLLTAARGGEVVRMRWQDINLDTGWWTIPREFSKNGKEHRVPLTSDALALVVAQQPDADKREREGFVFVGSGGTPPIDRLRKAGSACAKALGANFTSHDLRRTAASRMTEAGVPASHVSFLLNHTAPGAAATRIYDRYSYDAEKTVAVNTWARVLRAVLAGKTGATVLPMKRRRA